MRITILLAIEYIYIYIYPQFDIVCYSSHKKYNQIPSYQLSSFYAKFVHCIEADAMVRAWLRNSIASDLKDAYAFATSANNLWDNLKQKCGQCMQYHFLLQAKWWYYISTHYTKLQKLWNELAYGNRSSSYLLIISKFYKCNVHVSIGINWSNFSLV